MKKALAAFSIPLLLLLQPASSLSQVSTDPKIIEGAKKEGTVNL